MSLNLDNIKQIHEQLQRMEDGNVVGFYYKPSLTDDGCILLQIRKQVQEVYVVENLQEISEKNPIKLEAIEIL